MKEVIYWAIFIAVVLQIIGFLTGNPVMPETYDFVR